MSAFRRLVREIHRRSIWQVLGIYGVGAWIAYQVVLGLVEGLGLPGWVPPLAIVLFVIGLPIVLATAFVQEGLPGGGGVAPSAERSPAVEAPDEARRVETAASDVASAASAPPSAEPASRDARSAGLRHTLTWNRSITAGVLAFALLGLGVTGFMGMRALGIGPVGSLVAKGELDVRDPILVADFRSMTGDSVLARVVAEAFRVDLSQSRYVGLVDRSQVRDGLQRMDRPDSTQLTGDVARELAVRLGLKAMVEGEVSAAGGAYLITATLATPDSGRVLASFRETAKDSTDLLPAVDRLTGQLRERIGESLRTIRANPPLTQVTTRSLPALRKYIEARRELDLGHRERSVALFREALQLDPDFANAHRSLAVLFSNAGQQRDSMLYHAREAVRQEDHLTESERHHARGLLALVTGKREDARREFEDLLAIDSSDGAALINLSLVYGDQKNYRAAETLNRRALELDPSVARTAYWNIFNNRLDQGRIEAADSTIAEAGGRVPERQTSYSHWLIALARGDFEAADSMVTAHESDEPDPFLRGVTEAARGRLQRARSAWSSDVPPGQCGYDCLFASYLDLWVRGDREAAVRQAEDLLASPGMDSVDVSDRPYPQIALVLATAGKPQEAGRLIGRFEQEGIPDLEFYQQPLLLSARGFIELANGNGSEAVTLLRRAQQLAICQACLGALRGIVFEGASMPDSALAAYEAYIDTGWADRYQFGQNAIPNDPFFLVFSHEHAARLAEQLGDADRARLHWARVAELWKDADPELQPRVQEARRNVERLGRKGG